MARQIFKHVKDVSWDSNSMPGAQSVETSESVDDVATKSQDATRPDDRVFVDADVEVTVETQDVQLWATFISGALGTLTYKVLAHSAAAADKTYTILNAMVKGKSTSFSNAGVPTIRVTFGTYSADGSTTPVTVA